MDDFRDEEFVKNISDLDTRAQLEVRQYYLCCKSKHVILIM